MIHPFDESGIVRGQDGIARYQNRPRSLVEMLRSSVAAFLDDKVPMSRVRELMETDTGHDPAVWAELAAMGITVGDGARPAAQRAPAMPRRPRAWNSVTLADAIAMAVEPGATVSPAEAVQLVLSNGFVTNSKSFNVQVTNALSKDRRFGRIGRGQYERIAA